MEIYGGPTSGLHTSRREGTKLVETAADIFEEFGVVASRSGEIAVPAATSAQFEPLLEYIDYVPFPIDHIVKRSGLTATTVSSMLIRLELQGRVNVVVEGIFVLQNRSSKDQPNSRRRDNCSLSTVCGMISPATK